MTVNTLSYNSFFPVFYFIGNLDSRTSVFLNEIGDLVLCVSPSSLIFFLKVLKTSFLNFNILIDLFAVDYPNRFNRFEVNYILISPIFNYRIRLKVFVPLFLETLDSAASVYNSAAWLEREVWDLYGIFFFDHSDLRRILTDYGFDGHPMRKDFPLSGFFELRYNESLKRIVSEPVEFSQLYRYFDFRNPWF